MTLEKNTTKRWNRGFRPPASSLSRRTPSCRRQRDVYYDGPRHHFISNTSDYLNRTHSPPPHGQGLKSYLGIFVGVSCERPCSSSLLGALRSHRLSLSGKGWRKATLERTVCHPSIRGELIWTCSSQSLPHHTWSLSLPPSAPPSFSLGCLLFFSLSRFFIMRYCHNGFYIC